MNTFEDRYERRHRFFRRNFYWMIPLGLVAGAGMFIAVGFLVPWLWRVTVGDIFGFKPISFWQAWGLILLSQILFKANVHRNVGAGRMGRHGRERAAATGAGSAGPEQAV